MPDARLDDVTVEGRLQERRTDDRRRAGQPVRTGRVVAVLAVLAAVALVTGTVLEHARLHWVEDSSTVVRVLVGQGARLLYVDAEANGWAWLSAGLLGLLALVLATSAVARRGARLRWLPTAVLAGSALLLSVDEGAMLHETFNEIGVRLTDALGGYNAWLVPGVLVVLVAGVLLLRVARGIHPWLRRRLLLAGALFLAGALGMEVAGAAFALSSDAPNPWETGTYHALVAVEEGLEAAGALVALRAVLATLDVRVGTSGLSIASRSPGPARA